MVIIGEKMAECNTSRCSNERRLLRREFQKWNKEILYVIGLERLAEELMGAQKWKQFVKPFTDLESKHPSDWLPEETCYICNAKRLPPYDPASGIIPAVDGYTSLRIDTDDHSTSSDQATAPGSSPSCSSALSPWYVAALTSQPISIRASVLDQPLDLSFKSTPEELNSHKIVSNDLNLLLKVPQIPVKPGQRKRVDGCMKRSYTDEELQAALRDIQSGKLGTRRAAVIYGIPRSTLRNKVYKLANESKSRAHCRVSHGAAKQKATNKNPKPCNDVKSDDVDNTKNNVSASESLRQLLKQTITQKALGSSKLIDMMQDTNDNQNSICSNECGEPLKMFEHIECSEALAPVLSRVFANIHDLALGRYKENLSNKSLTALNEDLNLPILPDLIHRLAEERIELERECSKSHGYKDKTEINSSESLPHVILKVPSYKAASTSEIAETGHSVLFSPSSPESPSHKLSGNKGISSSLKELVTKNISQKLDSSSFEEPSVKSDQNKHIDSSTSWSIPSTLKDHAKEIVALNLTESSKAEKRTRPKRGRYRNYDRDNLARAVRAVQKGEMSVHRAGTFYGVPHSTLEYKVKERHLLRPRKRENFSNSSQVDETETESDTHYDTLPLTRTDLKSSFKQLSLMSNGMRTESEENHRPTADSLSPHFSLWQSMPFFTLDFPRLASSNFFASQMMRKLQENARLQEREESQKNKSQELGILETLIKSTLDKPTQENKKSFTLSHGLVDMPGRENSNGK